MPRITVDEAAAALKLSQQDQRLASLIPPYDAYLTKIIGTNEVPEDIQAEALKLLVAYAYDRPVTPGTTWAAIGKNSGAISLMRPWIKRYASIGTVPGNIPGATVPGIPVNTPIDPEVLARIPSANPPPDAVWKTDENSDPDWREDESGTGVSQTVPKATQTDVVTGTDNTKYMTVARVFQAIARVVKTASRTVAGQVMFARNSEYDATSNFDDTRATTVLGVRRMLSGLVTSAALMIQKAGVKIGADATILNFTGDGVTVAGAGATKTINIPGSTSGPAGPFDPLAGQVVSLDDTEIDTLTNVLFGPSGEQSYRNRDPVYLFGDKGTPRGIATHAYRANTADTLQFTVKGKVSFVAVRTAQSTFELDESAGYAIGQPIYYSAHRRVYAADTQGGGFNTYETHWTTERDLAQDGRIYGYITFTPDLYTCQVYFDFTDITPGLFDITLLDQLTGDGDRRLTLVGTQITDNALKLFGSETTPYPALSYGQPMFFYGDDGTPTAVSETGIAAFGQVLPLADAVRLHVLLRGQIRSIKVSNGVLERMGGDQIPVGSPVYFSRTARKVQLSHISNPRLTDTTHWTTLLSEADDSRIYGYVVPHPTSSSYLTAVHFDFLSAGRAKVDTNDLSTALQEKLASAGAATRTLLSDQTLGVFAYRPNGDLSTFGADTTFVRIKARTNTATSPSVRNADYLRLPPEAVAIAIGIHSKALHIIPKNVLRFVNSVTPPEGSLGATTDVEISRVLGAHVFANYSVPAIVTVGVALDEETKDNAKGPYILLAFERFPIGSPARGENTTPEEYRIQIAWI